LVDAVEPVVKCGESAVDADEAGVDGLEACVYSGLQLLEISFGALRVSAGVAG
jgi:hypothetical protein